MSFTRKAFIDGYLGKNAKLDDQLVFEQTVKILRQKKHNDIRHQLHKKDLFGVKEEGENYTGMFPIYLSSVGGVEGFREPHIISGSLLGCLEQRILSGETLFVELLQRVQN